MNERTQQPPRRVRAIFRALSVLTAVEAGLGLALTACVTLLVPFHYATLSSLEGHPYSRSLSLLYLLGSTSALFDGVLLASSALLWKLRRTGLVLLSWTLIGEVVCVVGIVSMFTSGFSSNAESYVLGMGLMPFSPQIVTVFPIIAAILIYFAYRYLGIPAHEVEERPLTH